MAGRRLAVARLPVAALTRGSHDEPVEDDAPLAEGRTVEVSVRSIASGGAGVADLPDGRVAFVHRTAPGDRARVRITALKRSWGRAGLVELLDEGPGRRTAPCPFYDRCGGCTLEHLTYETQLRWKGRLVAEALRRIGGLEDIEPPPVVPSPGEFAYRSRVSFHLRRLGRDRVVAGFHELERPGRIVDVTDACLLPEEPLARIWGALRRAWGPGADRLPAGRTLRLTLRSVTGGALLLIEPEEPPVGGNAPGNAHPDAAALVDAVPGLQAVWWRDRRDQEPVLLAGSPDTEETWWGRTLRLGPSAFLQVNRAVAERLHDAVLARLDPAAAPGRRFLDAYCGVGAYGRRLAAAGGRVTGIELDPAAVAEARRDAPEGLRVLEGRVEDRIEEALPADVAVLNPPRSGLHESVPAVLRDAGPARIVYVSCDPPTLARDLGRLEGVYRLADLEAFDLFPQTAHVESVATLERQGG